MRLPAWTPAWVEDPRLRRLALPVGGAILVVLVIVAAVWGWLSWRESRSNQALAEAIALVQQATPDGTPEARAKAMLAVEGVLRDHSRTSAAPQAAYLLGNLQYAAGQYAAARGAYETAIAKDASGTLKALSAVGIGYTWEAEKNYANASAAYETALKSLRPMDFLYEDALTALARTQDLGGKPAAALETYQRLLKDVPDSRRAEDLKTRVADLKSRPSK
jgi:tetratricopeptide (TPR) repeat protein